MKTQIRSGRFRKAMLSLAAVLAGGSTFTSCDTKVKVAVTSALETTLLTLLDPAIYLGDGGTGGTGTGGLLDQQP